MTNEQRIRITAIRQDGCGYTNGFFQIVMDAHNHTRMYDNNGFTPNEIFEKFERPKLKPLP